MQKFAQADTGTVRDVVAEKLNIGSGEQYRKEKYIVDNKSSLSPEDFANWDESNLRQRVLGNTNPVKLGRCFEFLNNWYGFKQGTNQYSLSKLLISSEEYCPKNQTELAESYGITTQTMNNYVRMANMIPELQDWVETGILAPLLLLMMTYKMKILNFVL